MGTRTVVKRKGLPDFRCASDHMEMLVEVRLRSRRPLRPQSGYAQSHRPTEPKSTRRKEPFSFTNARKDWVGQQVQRKNWSPPEKGTIVAVYKKCLGDRYDELRVRWDYMGMNPKTRMGNGYEPEDTKKFEWADERRRRLTEKDIPSQSYLHSAEEVIARRRLVDHARMEAQDADAMSPSELAMHRRRLAHGTRVSPVLAALMDEIEEAKHNHA